MSDEARHAFVVSIFLFAVVFVLVVVSALKSKSLAGNPTSNDHSPALAPSIVRRPSTPSLPTKVTTAPAATSPAVGAASASAPIASAPPAVSSAAPSAEAPASPALRSAMAKFEPYAERAKDAQTQTQFKGAIKEFAKGLTPEERVAYGRYLAEDDSLDLPLDRVLLMIALIQGPLPVGPQRTQLDEIMREARVRRSKTGAQPAPAPASAPADAPQQVGQASAKSTAQKL